MSINKGNVYLGISGDMKLLTGTGRTVTEGDIEIKKSERTVDGTLRSDLIARKKKYTISYEVLQGEDLEAIIDIYEYQVSGNTVVLKIYDRDDTYNEYNVEMASLDRSRITVLGNWLWSGVTIDLEEI